MQTITIDIPQKKYDVLVGTGIFKKLLHEFKKINLAKNIFVVVDSNVYKLYQNEIDKLIDSYKGKINFLVIEVNEKLKSFSTLQNIYKTMLNNNYSRDSLLVAMGGGIVGDISGFVAATFSRGIQYVQVPTTLLSTVDSSVGGKTGINFGKTKNIIGSFYQPNLVLIDVSFLKTLEREEFLSGIGEVVKYAYLTNVDFYKYVKKNIDKIFDKNARVISKIISESVRFKGDVVVSDEKESGNRKILNLGHTFAHALEVETKFKLKHGQAVIVGISAALFLSYKLRFINSSKLEELLALITIFKNEINIGKINFERAILTMQRDKKNRENKIKFVLLKDIGNILIDVEAHHEDILYAMENGIGVFK